MSDHVVDRFDLALEVVLRAAREEDLPELEWFGEFTPHRELIREAYHRQERGEVVMLVAEVNGFPAGQAWVDLTRKAVVSAGYLWAVRVFPLLRGRGIGAQLLAAAERVLRERGYAFADIGVEKDNPRARRLYERMGYRVVGEEREEYGYTTPAGEPVRVPVDEWILRKELGARGNGAGEER